MKKIFLAAKGKSVNSAERKTAVSGAARKRKELLFPMLAAVYTVLPGAFGFQLVFPAAQTSAAIDKGAHILTGRGHLQGGDFGINPKQPPLLKMLAAGPLRELQTAAESAKTNPAFRNAEVRARQELEKLKRR